MTETLREFVTATDKKIVPIFHATGVIYPMWHAVTASGEQRIVVQPHPDKEVAALLMRAYFVLHDVVRYVFIDEAWQLWIPPATGTDEINAIHQHGLRDHPGRIEVLMYQAEEVSGIAFTAHRVITRPPHDKARLGPLEFVTSTQSEGRLVGMLPARGMVQ